MGLGIDCAPDGSISTQSTLSRDLWLTSVSSVRCFCWGTSLCFLFLSLWCRWCRDTAPPRLCCAPEHSTAPELPLDPGCSHTYCKKTRVSKTVTTSFYFIITDSITGTYWKTYKSFFTWHSLDFKMSDSKMAACLSRQLYLKLKENTKINSKTFVESYKILFIYLFILFTLFIYLFIY